MIIFNLLIPTAIILLPMFTMVNRMHLVNTLPALVFPYFQGFAPMGLIICRNYFEDLPDELMEAGKLDGCSNMQVFLQNHAAPGRTPHPGHHGHSLGHAGVE
ncbi:MAG: ABC transporter permease subunit [Enterocloster sp.]